MAVVTTAVAATVGVAVSAHSAHQQSEFNDAQMNLSQQQLDAQRARNERLKTHWQSQQGDISTGIEQREEIADLQEGNVVDRFGQEKKLQDLQITRGTENFMAQADTVKSKSNLATVGAIDTGQAMTIADMMEIQHQQSIDAQNQLEEQILAIKSEEMSEIAELEERGDVLEEKIAGLTEV
jgi:hypothetical protein